MLRRLIPTYHAQSIRTIDYSLLQKKGFTHLFFDLDNTLSAYYDQRPSQDLIDFVSQLKAMGFHVYVISNNHESRVAPFAQDLEVPYLYSAKKPGKRRLKLFIQRYVSDDHSCILIGDQLLTDVLCSHAIGIRSILVEPVVEKDLIITRFNRFIDKRIRHYLKKKNRLQSIEKE